MNHRILATTILALLGLLAPAFAQTDTTSPAAPAPAGPPPMVQGQIVAARVRGTVTAKNLDTGDIHPLLSGDKIAERYQVVTGANSSVVLVLSNGATVDLAADSSLDVAQFIQDPFSSSVDAATLTQEPSATSITRLNLTRGEIVGKVAHLNVDKGSIFAVDTPVGAAGIRGTVFRIVFHENANGKATLRVTTLEGTLVFRMEGSELVAISGGKQIVLSNITIPPAGTVFSTTGSTTTTSSTTTSGATTTTVTTTTTTNTENAQIQAAVQTIVNAVLSVTFPPSPPTPPAGTNPNPTTTTTTSTSTTNNNTTTTTTTTTTQPVNPTTVSPSG
jgi:hypothetical protein